jgi:hypothetical protein
VNAQRLKRYRIYAVSRMPSQVLNRIATSTIMAHLTTGKTFSLRIEEIGCAQNRLIFSPVSSSKE